MSKEDVNDTTNRRRKTTISKKYDPTVCERMIKATNLISPWAGLLAEQNGARIAWPYFSDEISNVKLLQWLKGHQFPKVARIGPSTIC